jgi:hypothetical protein
LVDEDLKRGTNKDMGSKDIFETASKKGPGRWGAGLVGFDAAPRPVLANFGFFPITHHQQLITPKNTMETACQKIR